MKSEKTLFTVRIETKCGKAHKDVIFAKNELGAKSVCTMICHQILQVSTSNAIITLRNNRGVDIAVKRHGHKWEPVNTEIVTQTENAEYGQLVIKDTGTMINGSHDCQACVINWTCEKEFASVENAHITSIDFIEEQDFLKLCEKLGNDSVDSLIEKAFLSALHEIKTRTKAKWVKFIMCNDEWEMKEYVAMLLRIGFFIDVIRDDEITFEFEFEYDLDRY
ncbi:MAG: hypothetical protein ACRCWB_11675 [Enterovibrio sp.]